ncbi:hypothetical protein KQR54_20190 [Mycobacterium gordonae]|nr:hypothetical protein [Mycobacterium gordonae]MCQ4363414.1 hypothetical protein [Mycobacterium gordonae]
MSLPEDMHTYDVDVLAVEQDSSARLPILPVDHCTTCRMPTGNR